MALLTHLLCIETTSEKMFVDDCKSKKVSYAACCKEDNREIAALCKKLSTS
jgi:hypothetical protein